MKLAQHASAMETELRKVRKTSTTSEQWSQFHGVQAEAKWPRNVTRARPRRAMSAWYDTELARLQAAGATLERGAPKSWCAPSPGAKANQHRAMQLHRATSGNAAGMSAVKRRI